MRVHKTIKSMVTKGYFPVVIGQKDHVEVTALLKLHVVHGEEAMMLQGVDPKDDPEARPPVMERIAMHEVLEDVLVEDAIVLGRSQPFPPPSSSLQPPQLASAASPAPSRPCIRPEV